jgi:excisionase family DNA binding protein
MIYTRQEAADQLQISLSTLDKFLKSGKIKAFRVGRQIRITEQALQDFLDDHILKFDGKPQAEIVRPVLRQ